MRAGTDKTGCMPPFSARRSDGNQRGIAWAEGHLDQQDAGLDLGDERATGDHLDRWAFGSGQAQDGGGCTVLVVEQHRPGAAVKTSEDLVATAGG